MFNSTNIRLYDVFLSSFILFLLSPLIIFLFFICLFESGSPIFVQKRVGKDKKAFNLIKFRTMKRNTPSLASHLINQKYVTRFGKVIRLLKLDELPQLINVISGEMSLVGPRPCLYNQFELIKLRDQYNLFSVKPGITGLAQINGIDMSDPKKLAETDLLMILKTREVDYFRYLFLTFFGKGMGDKVCKK